MPTYDKGNITDVIKKMNKISSRMDAVESNMIVFQEQVVNPKPPFSETTYENYVDWRLKVREQEDKRKRLKNIEYLSTLKKEVTKKCTCSLHAGINFIDTATGKIIEENMCPKIWYVHLCWLAFEQKRLKEFISSTPIEKFLSFSGAKNGRK